MRSIRAYDLPTQEYFWIHILFLLGQYDTGSMALPPLDTAVQDLMDNHFWENELED